MIRYYICEIIGDSKSEKTAFRPAVADYSNDCGWIDLRKSGDVKSGLFLVGFEGDVAPITTSKIHLLDPEHVKTDLNFILKSNIDAEYLDDFILKLLTEEALIRQDMCKPLRRGIDGQYRIHLHGRIYGNPPPKYRKGTFTESFNTGDSDTLGPDQSWTELEGDIDIVSNRCQSIASRPVARCDTALNSDDHYAQADIYDSGSADYGLLIRKDGTGTLTHYQATVEDGASKINRHKRIAGGFTALGAIGSVTWSSGDTLKWQADGSSISVYQNEVEKGTTITDTDITGNLYTGITGYDTGGILDDFEAGDLAAPSTRRVFVSQS